MFSELGKIPGVNERTVKAWKCTEISAPLHTFTFYIRPGRAKTNCLIFSEFDRTKFFVFNE